MFGIGSSTGLGQGQPPLSGLGAPSPQTAPQNNHVPIVAFNEEDLRKQAHSAFPAVFGGVTTVQKLGQKYNLPSSQTVPQNNHVPIVAFNEEDLRKQAHSAFPAFFGGVSAVQKLGEKYGVPSQQGAPQNGTTWDHIKDWGNVTGQNLEGISKDFWDVGKDVTSQNIGNMVHLGQSLYHDPKGTIGNIYHAARDNVTSFLSHPAQSIGEGADWLGDKGHDLKNDLEVIPHIFNGHPLTQEDHDHYKKWNSFVLNLGENLLGAKGLGAASRGIGDLASAAAGGLAKGAFRSGELPGRIGTIVHSEQAVPPHLGGMQGRNSIGAAGLSHAPEEALHYNNGSTNMKGGKWINTGTWNANAYSFNPDSALYRAQEHDRGGYSRIGRSWQKHSSRKDNNYVPVTGKPSKINKEGLERLQGMFADPTARIFAVPETSDITPGYHIHTQNGTGPGVHFYPDHYTVGFREPPKAKDLQEMRSYDNIQLKR